MSTPFVAYVRGLPDIPTVREINIRSGPNTNYALLFKSPVGTANLPVLEVKADDTGANLNGKVYQWFRLQFPNGQSGWARDDLLEVSGDGTTFGYSLLLMRSHAFALTRAATTAPPPPAPIAPVGVVSPLPVPAVPAPPPAVPVPPAAPAPVVPAAPAPTPAVPGSTPMAIIKTQGAANTRKGPGIVFERTGVTLPRHGRYPIIQVQRESTGQQYRWFQLNHNGQLLWIREDLVSHDGDTSAFGLPTDLYPSPMKENYWWVRGYNMPPNIDMALPQHDGWDQGAATGEPIYCGPNGGLVVKSFQCAKCTPDRPNTLSQGFSLGDARIFNDQGWGNGYGNHIIVRYTSDLLPQSTRNLIASRGFPGGTMFVMYAHLHERMVAEGMPLAPGQQIGTCGNTGNSEATHIHLEVRASRSADFTGWFNVRGGVMDAVALFKR